jgi:outer membrane protein
MKSILVTISLLLIGISVQAQQRFGVVDTDSIMVSMPGFKEAQAEMETYAKQLQKQQEMMQQNLQQKYQELTQLDANNTPLARIEQLQKEFTDAQTRAQQFQQTAQQNFGKKQQDLLEPIQRRMTQAIESYAKANNFAFIAPADAFLFFNNAEEVTASIISSL